MKTVVITGVDRGLGLAFAQRILEAGNRVLLACLDPEGQGPRSLQSRFPELSAVAYLNLDDAPSIAEAARIAEAAFGFIDRLINNAAILGDIEKTIGDDDFDLSDVERVLRINAVGTLRVTSQFWKLLALGSDKLVVNISSEAGSIGQNWRDRWFGYAMSKAAMNMMGALVHRRLLPLGGRVMQVHPGYVKTYMHGSRNDAATYEPDEAARLALQAVEFRLASPARPQPDYFDLHGTDLPW